jgi:O-antigen ligase
MIVENFGVLTPPTLNKHYSIDASGNAFIKGFELNRSIAVLNILLWPAVLCASSYWSGRKRALIAGVMVSGVVLTTLGSIHETSKVALIAGLIGFALAYIWRRGAIIVVASIWTILVLGIVFASNVAYDQFALHQAPWVQRSAQQRIVIWSDLASRVSAAPVVGVGARTGYVLSNRSKASLKASLKEPAKKHAYTIARHAHNVYLQTWFELGGVGAALLLIVGLYTLRGMTKLPASTQPYALATFAVFMLEIASSWEIWQRWYAALFALATIYLLLGIRSVEAKSEHP